MSHPVECPRCARLERRHDRERRARLEAEAIADQFTRQALHDPLTGLANRSLFQTQLDNALTQASRTGRRVGVLFIDLDDFKDVNDTLGHPAGDELLVELGRRLAGCVRPGDVAARFGGDEFAVLMTDVDVAGGTELLVETAVRVRTALVRPHEVGGKVWRSRTSIGIKVAGAEESGDAVLRDADAAMYAAKRSGTGRHHVFDAATRSAIVERLDLATALHHALDRHEVEAWYQPIVELGTRRVVGAEALARWPGAPGGGVPPSVFVGLAHDTGMLDELSAQILEAAARQTVAWGHQPPWVTHVNLHPRELTDHRLPRRVAEVLRRTGLPAQRLCLEITEQSLVEDDAASVGVLGALADLGVQLAVDDFGAAYASFGYLKRLPVDLIKVDRSLIAGVGSEATDDAIVSAVVRMAEALGTGLVAEGVETERQAQALARLGVRWVQGWHYAPAVPAAAWDDTILAITADEDPPDR